MTEYQIWSEGYAATGECSDAQLIATIQAESFDEAVRKYVDAVPSLKAYYQYNEQTGYHSIWACRLFDNEEAARKSFG